MLVGGLPRGRAGSAVAVVCCLQDAQPVDAENGHRSHTPSAEAASVTQAAPERAVSSAVDATNGTAPDMSKVVAAPPGCPVAATIPNPLEYR